MGFNSFNGGIIGKVNNPANYVAIGYIYDPVRDAFIPPKPFNSWILNEDTCCWDPPVSYPNDENQYYWDEENLNWVAL